VADLGALANEASTCPRCDLASTRTQVVFGDGDPRADLLLVGEGPGADEDRLGVPFVGRSGQLLTRLVEEEVGLGRDRCYTTNIVKCRPPGNRDPKPHEAAACAPWLEGQLELIAPKVVVTFGNVATRRLLGTREGITALRGRTHPWRGVTLVPTFHPAAALRGGPATVEAMREDLGRARLALESHRPGGLAAGGGRRA
jgi:DNA polymerase